MQQRPILSAHWTELLLLNFRVPTDLIASVAPAGTEPDLHEGQAYVSVVGFRFHAIRFYGLAIPGHTSFPEINLRYYVCRRVGNEIRRGVVFVREMVPRRAVACAANWLYNESYVTRSMRSSLRMQGPVLAPNDSIEYAWRTRPRSQPEPPRPVTHSPAHTATILRPARPSFRKQYWNRMAGSVAAPLSLPTPGSLEEFLIEHYWGYVRARDGTTREYEVSHEPWQVATLANVIWDCNPLATYGLPFAEFLDGEPASAFIAAGSPVRVFRGHRI